MAIPAVTFVYADWVAAFPTFQNINSADGQMYFDGASSLCANDTCSPAWSTKVAMGSGQVPLLQRLLWLLTCHLAYLGAFRDANGNPSSTGTQPPAPLVGRVSQAAEGSVNVTVELDTTGYPVPAFFQQTPWGLQYWQATVQFRTAVYVAHPTIVVNGAYPSRAGVGWPGRIY